MTASTSHWPVAFTQTTLAAADEKTDKPAKVPTPPKPPKVPTPKKPPKVPTPPKPPKVPTPKKEKITICHKGNTMEVDEKSLGGHLDHGDYIGECVITPSKNK